MVKRVKAAKKPAVKLPKIASGELLTLLDFMRYAVSRFNEARLAFAHGTTDPVAEAAFLICEALHLHPDQFESFANARVTVAESKHILDLIGWLTARGETYAYAFEKPQVIRAAIDHAHVKPDAAIAGAREIAFFPPMTGG